MKRIEVNFFWRGERFSFLQFLVLKSHLKVGHVPVIWLSGNAPHSSYWKKIEHKIKIKNADDVYAVGGAPATVCDHGDRRLGRGFLDNAEQADRVSERRQAQLGHQDDVGSLFEHLITHAIECSRQVDDDAAVFMSERLEENLDGVRAEAVPVRKVLFGGHDR